MASSGWIRISTRGAVVNMAKSTFKELTTFREWLATRAQESGVSRAEWERLAAARALAEMVSESPGER